MRQPSDVANVAEVLPNKRVYRNEALSGLQGLDPLLRNEAGHVDEVAEAVPLGEMKNGSPFHDIPIITVKAVSQRILPRPWLFPNSIRFSRPRSPKNLRRKTLYRFYLSKSKYDGNEIE